MGIVSLNARITASGVRTFVTEMFGVKKSVEDTGEAAKKTKTEVRSLGETLSRAGKLAREFGAGFTGFSLPKDARDFGAVFRGGANDIGRAGAALTSFVTGAVASAATGLITLAAAGTAAGVALGGLVAVSAFQKAASFDSIVRGLATVNEDADSLGAQLLRLQEIAKLPGLGFEEAARGALTLQNVGLSALMSERAIKSFGNALASAGKGKAELDGVINALSQIVSKGALSAEEVQQLAERGVAIRPLLKDAFGTSDTEEIKKLGLTIEDVFARLVRSAEKLPPATGGIANQIENMADRADKALRPLGRGLAAFLEGAAPTIDRVFDKFEKGGERAAASLNGVVKSGVLGDVLEKMEKGIERAFGTADLGELFDRALASSLSIASVLPDGLARAAKWAAAVGRNLMSGFDYVGKMLPLILELASGAFSSVVDTADKPKAVRGGLGFDPIESIGLGWVTKAGAGALKALKQTDKDGKTLEERFRGISLPKFEALPDLPFFSRTLDKDGKPVGDPLFAQYDKTYNSYLASIKKNSLPVGEIPGNLPYGGKKAGALAGGEAGGGGADAFDKMLAAMEETARNTGKTSDALTLRRQALGGGELAKLGVSAAELRSFGATGHAPRPEDYLSRPADSRIARDISDMIDQSVRRKTGQRVR